MGFRLRYAECKVQLLHAEIWRMAEAVALNILLQMCEDKGSQDGVRFGVPIDNGTTPMACRMQGIWLDCKQGLAASEAQQCSKRGSCTDSALAFAQKESDFMDETVVECAYVLSRVDACKLIARLYTMDLQTALHCITLHDVEQLTSA